MITLAPVRCRLVPAALAALMFWTGLPRTGVAVDPDQPPVPLEQWFDTLGTIWSLSPEKFISLHHAEGFAWVTTGSQATARSIDPRLSFMGLRVWEALVRFDEGHLREISLSLYNRGDAGDLEEAAFQQGLRTLNERLRQWTRRSGVDLPEEERTTAVTIHRRAWIAPPNRLDLSWSYTPKHREEGQAVPFRSEFVRLQFSPANPERPPHAVVTAPNHGKPPLLSIVDLRARVRRQPNGDVVITGIPMVDQGPKGYCAAAVAERILRYFGRPVDQHEIAQLAATSASGGTSPPAMIAALRRISLKMEMEVNVHADFDYRDFEKLRRDYNRLAKQEDRPTVSDDEVIDLSEIYQQMDTGLLRQARRKREAARSQFRADVERFVRNGVPLAWSVMMGKIDESPAIKVIEPGGHLRLIIGFSERSGDIVYSDTWGAGHEQKRMSLDDAWTITTGLYTVHPRNIRF